METKERRPSRPGRKLESAARTTSVSKLRLRAWLHLLFSVKGIERELRQRLADRFDETLPRLDVLAALSRVPEGMTMTELSGSLRLSKGNITGLIGRLVRDGLVERRDKDGRSVIVALSKKGRRLFDGMAEAHEAWLDDLLAPLDRAELRDVIEILSKLRKGR